MASLKCNTELELLSASVSIGQNSLRPTTPAWSSRYASVKKLSPASATIAPGFFSFAGEPEPTYLPPGWSACQHPEGQTYFAYESTPKIVTADYIYSPEIQKKILHYVAVVKKELCEKAISLPATAELFLHLDDETDLCEYYFVDHAPRTCFWLEKLDTDDLGLSEVVSDAHLRMMLEHLYWTHLEQFPSHRIDQIRLDLDELIDIFINGQGDQMTGNNSTFPYGTDECKRFLRLLTAARERKPSSYTTWLISRLWGTIWFGRFHGFYGERYARLSREQTVRDFPEGHRGWFFASCSPLLFRIPDAYLEHLNSLWIDRQVYGRLWCQFISGCCDEWKLYSTWTLILLAINILLLITPGTSRLIASISMLLCDLALLFAAALLVQHHRSADWTAAEASVFLEGVQRETTGFQQTALSFSIPKAFFLLALGVASTQGLFWIHHATNVYVTGSVVLFLVVLAMFTGLLSLRGPMWLRRILRRCRSKTSDECEV
ncbi:hypothetical protein A0H81_12480 [Grifola frondosa]|uniref:WW domain-containing protein n=1 Tax=Grifola frondosa TaxID=5627 RepID=A0A1C7LS69_GRIFR|nr:hypothetical protein A0H81_12480 [Grifola frondosa]